MTKMKVESQLGRTQHPQRIFPEISRWGFGDRVRRRAVRVGAAMSQTGLCLLTATVLQAR